MHDNPPVLAPLARRLSGWLLAALALSVSRALVNRPPQDGQDRVEICTALGIQWVRLSEAVVDPTLDSVAPATGALDLCGKCSLAAERFAPLLPSLTVVAAVTAIWAVPWFQAFQPVSVAAHGPLS